MRLSESLRPARVGYVVKSYPRFSETFIVREILAREAAGQQIVIASLRPPVDGRFHELIAHVRAPVTWIDHETRSARRLWDALRRGSDLPGLERMLPQLIAADPDVAGQAVLLAAWARAEGVDHLHAHFASLPGRTARLAAGLADLTYSVTAHAKDIFHSDVDRVELARVLGEAHHVVTVSDFNVDFLTSEFAAAAPRVHRVYNGIDLVDLPFDDPRVRPPVIAAVGRLVAKKGFADLLDAVALLREEGTEARLELAGTGRCGDALRNQVTATGLDDVVTMHGNLPQHEVISLLRRSSVFAAPCVVADDGDRDGLPTVLLEAMALGTPCVSTPVTGIPELVRDGSTGLMVPERDPHALAAALRRTLADGDLRHRLATAARSLIEAEFDVAHQARSLQALLPAALEEVA